MYLRVAVVEDYGVTGHLLVLHQVEDVPHLHLLTPDLSEPLPPDHGHNPLVSPLVLLVPVKKEIRYMLYTLYKLSSSKDLLVGLVEQSFIDWTQSIDYVCITVGA